MGVLLTFSIIARRLLMTQTDVSLRRSISAALLG